MIEISVQNFFLWVAVFRLGFAVRDGISARSYDRKTGRQVGWWPWHLIAWLLVRDLWMLLGSIKAFSVLGFGPFMICVLLLLSAPVHWYAHKWLYDWTKKHRYLFMWGQNLKFWSDEDV